MKAEFYITFDAIKNSYGTVTRVSPTKMTKGDPPTGGDLVVKFVMDIPKELLEPVEVEVQLDARNGVVQALQKTAEQLSQP